MATSIEASYGDHQYMKYIKDLDGISHGNKTTKNVFGIAIFGLGRIGTIHLENVWKSPRANILYCIDESTERTDFAQNKWDLKGHTVFLKPSEQDRVFQDRRMDLVIVCTPTFTHESIVLKALESGKAVFCEKPLSLNDEGIAKCLEAAKKNGKPLFCAFNRRFDPGFRSLKDRVDSGEIGKAQVIKTCSRDSPKPSTEYLKISGGIFHDCAVHDIDYICWVLGEYPVSVSAYAHSYFEDIRALEDHDTVAIMMKFPSGAIATIDLSRYAVYGYDQRVEIFGPKGMLTCGEQRPTGVRSHSGKGTTAVPIYYSFVSKYQESYDIEMEHFLNVLQGTEESEITGDSILSVSKIASACEESARSGKTVSLTW
ncbi:hypothetical protein JTE90_024662 [Oedothorax gibbosus]|uniref:Inositol 2-dehydrogenase n=1 Tax=Oedothorax gibbosus TaxID=931172 RepID=A0AAV6U3J5_9ARAC|nr:hypothetical protein JTE90_024662 [Oedothorax gibbosus]